MLFLFGELLVWLHKGERKFFIAFFYKGAVIVAHFGVLSNLLEVEGSKSHRFQRLRLIVALYCLYRCSRVCVGCTLVLRLLHLLHCICCTGCVVRVQLHIFFAQGLGRDWATAVQEGRSWRNFILW